MFGGEVSKWSRVGAPTLNPSPIKREGAFLTTEYTEITEWIVARACEPQGRPYRVRAEYARILCVLGVLCG